MSKAEMQERIGQLERLLADARAQRDALEKAVRWALGEDGEFKVRSPAYGPYYWRRELRERAGLVR